MIGMIHFNKIGNKRRTSAGQTEKTILQITRIL